MTVDTPANKVIGNDLFEDSASAESAVLGIYSAISGTSNILLGVISTYPAIYADETVYTAQAPTTLEFYNGAISTTNATIESNFWNFSYRFIYQINACLEKLKDNTALTNTVKNQLTGECLFFRAFIYFQMINLFGDVPLITGTDYRLNEQMKRTETSKIKEAIHSDLILAKELLSEFYPGGEKVRANKWAVTALLARYYLYMEQWQQAEIEATAIINSGSYHLSPLDEAFLANSTEAILQIRPVLPGFNTTEGNQFIPTELSRPTFALSPSLIAAFETNDKRKTSWTKEKTVNGISYTYPFKYKKRADFSENFKLTEYNMIFRLSEILLIRAESRAYQGALHGATADLDSIRQRAGLPLISIVNPGISVDDLITSIQQERRIELFIEGGHRWFDLKRRGKAYETLSVIKPGWKTTNELWPVPQAQIDLNPSLSQNDGY